VISYYQQALCGTATSYKNVLGGIWDEVKHATITQVHKIKSHMSYAKACEVGVGQWWAGNAQADALAQKVAERALVAGGEANSYNKLVAKAEKFVRDLAQALVMWKGSPCRPYDLERVAAETSANARALPAHEYEWDPVAQVWVCARCWKRRKRGREASRVTLLSSGGPAISPLGLCDMNYSLRQICTVGGLDFVSNSGRRPHRCASFAARSP
jgi:hypothetical protein